MSGRNSASPLKKEEKYEAQGQNTKKRDGLIEQNIGLVHMCCHRLKGRGIEYDELFSAGCLGLCKAAEKFDRERGIKFSTYAVPVILGEIKCLFRDGGRIKIGRALKERTAFVLEIKQRLCVKLGREPTVSELSKRTGLSPEQTAQALSAASPVLSLSTDGPDGESMELSLSENGCEQEVVGKTALFQAMNRLSEEERMILEQRYFGGKTQSETAKIFGTSQVQISRKEKAALLKMRQQLL